MVLKGNSGQGSERKKESCRESSHGQRENEYHHEQNADRNIDVKVVLTEVWDGNQESGGQAILVIKWQRTWLNYV